MTSILSVFEKYWYMALLIIAFYLLVIVIIEIKDIDYLHFNFSLKRHEYKDTSDWGRMNYLFLHDFKYYTLAPVQDVVGKIHTQFKKLIVISLKIEQDPEQVQILQNFVADLPETSLKQFLVNPFNWLNQRVKQPFPFFLLHLFNKKSYTYKKLLPYIVELEELLFDELQIDITNINLIIESGMTPELTSNNISEFNA